MNYPIPFQQTNTAYFYVNSTNNMGTFNKPLDGRVQISVDYSKLVPSVTVSKFWFEIEPGGVPPLTIDSTMLTGSVLTFILGGGWPNSYNVVVNAILSTGEVHSDILIVNVLGEDYGCCGLISPSQTNVLTETGEVFTNRFPRFFVSATAPTNANLLDRWYNLLDGNWYDFVTDGRTDFWVLSGDHQVGSGVPPPGSGGGGTSGISGTITIKKMNPLPFDGTTNVFTMTATDGTVPNVTTDNSLFVSMDGVWQEPTVQYTATSNVITFATAPAVDSYEFILWFFGGIA